MSKQAVSEETDWGLIEEYGEHVNAYTCKVEQVEDQVMAAFHAWYGIEDEAAGTAILDRLLSHLTEAPREVLVGVVMSLAEIATGMHLTLKDIEQGEGTSDA